MTKRYDDSIEVVADPYDGEGPVAFSWRGRRYDVDQRLQGWREAGEWWNGHAPGAEVVRDRRYYRVLARPAGTLATGDVDSEGVWASVGAVYDLYWDPARNRWHLARVWD
jgi:hypothetical protein